MTEERTGIPVVSPEQAPGQPTDARPPGRVRAVLARVTTGLAALVVLLVLVAPTETGHLSPVGFLRVPVEALLGVVAVLVLPARARRVAVVLGGVLLGLLAVVKVLDIGFFAVLDRAFNPVLDWGFLEAAVVFLTGSVGPAGAAGSAVGAVVLAVALLTLVTLAAARLSGVVVRHRAGAARTTAVLGVVWLICAVFGVRLVTDVPVAAHATYDRMAQAARGSAGPGHVRRPARR